MRGTARASRRGHFDGDGAVSLTDCVIRSVVVVLEDNDDDDDVATSHQESERNRARNWNSPRCWSQSLSEFVRRGAARPGPPWHDARCRRDRGLPSLAMRFFLPKILDRRFKARNSPQRLRKRLETSPPVQLNRTTERLLLSLRVVCLLPLSSWSFVVLFALVSEFP